MSINPSLNKTILTTIDNLSQEQFVLINLFEDLKPDFIEANTNSISIDIQSIIGSKYRDWFLYRFLDKYGFSKQQIDNINASLGSKVGSQFHTQEYVLNVDREFAFITRNSSKSNAQYSISLEEPSIDAPIKLEFALQARNEIIMTDDQNTAFLDADTLNFPLELTHWKSGDSFQPLGMAKFQKISDFFINSKISRHQKDSVWILRSGAQIVWIIGYRIDHRFRIQDSTKRVYRISLKD